MAKTAAVKKASTSVRSRSARRAASPSIDTDKSLKNIPLPVEKKETRPSVLAIHQGAGVSKKSKNGRKAQLSAKAKRRQDKSADRAEAIMDKKETNIEKSKDRARNVQERAKAWEETNKKALALKKAKHEKEMEDMMDEIVDDEMKIDDISEGQADAPADAPADTPAVVESMAASVPLPDEDEIM